MSRSQGVSPGSLAWRRQSGGRFDHSAIQAWWYSALNYCVWCGASKSANWLKVTLVFLQVWWADPSRPPGEELSRPGMAVTIPRPRRTRRPVCRLQPHTDIHSPYLSLNMSQSMWWRGQQVTTFKPSLSLSQSHSHKNWAESKSVSLSDIMSFFLKQEKAIYVSYYNWKIIY